MSLSGLDWPLIAELLVIAFTGHTAVVDLPAAPPTLAAMRSVYATPAPVRAFPTQSAQPRAPSVLDSRIFLPLERISFSLLDSTLIFGSPSALTAQPAGLLTAQIDSWTQGPPQQKQQEETAPPEAMPIWQIPTQPSDSFPSQLQSALNLSLSGSDPDDLNQLIPSLTTPESDLFTQSYLDFLNKTQGMPLPASVSATPKTIQRAALREVSAPKPLPCDQSAPEAPPEPSTPSGLYYYLTLGFLWGKSTGSSGSNL